MFDLSTLPDVPARRVAVRVTKDALRQVRGGHPWVYADSVTSTGDADAPAGSLAVVFDDKRAFAAIGLWDPASPIRVRILHAGKPLTVDDEFWADRVRTALAIREPLDRTGTTGYRVLFGENDGVGGLIADRYADTIVVKVYSVAWYPHLLPIISQLADLSGIERIVLRLSRNVADAPETIGLGLIDGMVLAGPDVDGPVLFQENGLTFEADVIQGQKTGHFLDQRDNRQWVRSVADGASVLDVFSSTGGFSVYAAAGGARFVHAVDISPHAVAATARNLAHNSELTHATTFTSSIGDAFEVMAQLRDADERFDIVVIDPPSFARRANERNRAVRAYRKLSELGVGLVKPGGRLLQASCSAHVSSEDLSQVVHSAVRSHGRMARDERITGHALDHPVSFRQGEYLSAISLVL